MDHIESPPYHYGDSDFSYPVYQVPRMFQGAQTDLPVLHTYAQTECNVPQEMVDFEYISQITGIDSATDTLCVRADKQMADLLASEYVNIPSGKDIIPDEFTPVQSYTYNSKQESLLGYPDLQRHLVAKPADNQERLNTVNLSRESLKLYNELQSYSDMIQFPDMTPREDQSFSSQTYPDTIVGLPVVGQGDQSPVDDLIMPAYDCSVSAHDTKYDYFSGYNYTSYQVPQRVQYRRTLDDVTSVRAKYENGPGPVRQRPGRSRKKRIPTEEELQTQREKKLKRQHLWEFIFEILNNPLYNPSILKWENQNEGVFRFIQPEAVAQLWGTLKSNENMTYETMSRSMRQHYKRGILEKVEGRRLVYKFSLAALTRMKEKRSIRKFETL